MSFQRISNEPMNIQRIKYPTASQRISGNYPMNIRDARDRDIARMMQVLVKPIQMSTVCHELSPKHLQRLKGAMVIKFGSYCIAMHRNFLL